MIGVQLVPLLLERGFAVAGMTRSASKADSLAAAGAEPVVCDVFDHDALVDAVRAFAPEVVMHQLTDLPDRVEEIGSHMALNNRIRREGTRNLIEAARVAGATRFLAQTVAWDLPGEGGDASKDLERQVLEFGGVVVRYGRFYGPGTFHPGEGERPEEPPMIHVAEAARRTVELIDAPSGVYVVADDT